jgi:nitrite reductase/ring-hydroxylating ferredoxin subunit
MDSDVRDLKPASTRGEPAPWLENAWYVVDQASGVTSKPKAYEFLGHPIVVYRTEQGSVAALVDRCPHRNVPLSLGKVRSDGIECAYHGWRFAADGKCVAIPALCERIPPLARVDSFATCEQDGWVWVYGTPGVAPESKPFRFPHMGDARYSHITYAKLMNAPMIDVAENALDVPHTSFLHKGLFRNGKKRKRVEVEVRELEDRVEAEFLGEEAPKGLIGRMIAPQGGNVKHVDRFMLPNIVQVEYRLSESLHMINSVVLTPTHPYACMLFAHVSFRLAVPSALIAPIVTPVTIKVLEQDAVILEAQVETTKRFGGRRFVSTSLDVLGPAIDRLLRNAASPMTEARTPGATRRISMEVG